MLNEAGIPPSHVMVYMLIGYKADETMEQVIYRYRRLKEAGCKPFPMVYNNLDRERKAFQRWVVRRYDEIVPWDIFFKHAPIPRCAREQLQLPLVVTGGTL